MTSDYFAILELSPNASRDEIHRAYRRLAKRYHPDLNKSPEAHDKFIAIAEAYEALMEENFVTPPNSTTTDEERKEYEEFTRLIHERARKQAQMRYAEFVKRNEALQKSGFNDLSLVLKIASRIIAIPFTLGFLLSPIFLAIKFDAWLMVLALFMWPIGIFLAWNIRDQRKNYFMPGTFYYNFKRLKSLFIETHETSEDCFYCKGKKANSKPYRIELFKLKDIKVKIDGYRTQKANYINDSAIILIPRSQKAFVVHVSVAIIKIGSVMGMLFLLSNSSVIWRLILGLGIGGILGFIVLVIMRTRSNVSYLYTANLIIRVAVWVTILRMNSTVYLHPLHIQVTGFVNMVVVCILFFDCFLMQFIDFIIKGASYLSVIRQYPEVEEKTHHKYRAYNEIPVLSVIYPLFRWIWS